MASRRKYLLDDGNWGEVQYINTYAVFMGYLSMSIKGLGFLVLTWTTVVLLGGFVSMLQKKDFWCLTFITLVQTAGIIDVNLNEKLGYVENAILGMFGSIFWGVMTSDPNSALLAAMFSISVMPILVAGARFLMACVLLLVQIVVLTAILCPLAITYVLGILISGGISLWRLIEHDYGGDSDVEASNLAPAMDTLYYLALLQGVLFCYRFMLRHAGNKLAKRAATKDCDDSELQVVSDYLQETRRGCEKNPSFAKGRNLITDAIDKIGSNSPVECISGVKILYTAIHIVETKRDEITFTLDFGDMIMEKKQHQDIVTGQHMLMKHLVMSASFSRHALQKLLETLDSRGIHDRETRSQAAKIVERLAYNINLEQFPRGIEHISSMIGTFEEYCIAEPYQRENDQYWSRAPSPAIDDDARGQLRKAYKGLLLRGMSILQKLASDESNCKVMSDTRGLVSKIMAPISSDLLDHTTNDHGAWSDVVEESMEVMNQLAGAQGETGSKLRYEISSCEEAIRTLRRIFSCNKCDKDVRLKSIRILTRLYMNISESTTAADFVVPKKESGREDFVRMLVDTFICMRNKNSSFVRGSAGEALSAVILHGRISDATIFMQTSGDVVDNLTRLLLYDENETCRQAASEILEQLCIHYTKNDEYLGKLNKAILEVIGKILHCGGETHNGKDRVANDIESQCDGTEENNQNDKKEQGLQAMDLSNMSTNLLSSLLSLFGTVFDTMFISDLAPQLDASKFLNMLKAVIEKRNEPTIENLSLYKTVCKMIISMMNHGGSRFVKWGDHQRLIETLYIASNNMLDLDFSMVFRSTNAFGTRSSRLDRCTLKSLAKEAKELHAKMPSTSVSV